jgi:hypothetical protein
MRKTNTWRAHAFSIVDGRLLFEEAPGVSRSLLLAGGEVLPTKQARKDREHVFRVNLPKGVTPDKLVLAAPSSASLALWVAKLGREGMSISPGLSAQLSAGEAALVSAPRAPTLSARRCSLTRRSHHAARRTPTKPPNRRRAPRHRPLRHQPPRRPLRMSPSTCHLARCGKPPRTSPPQAVARSLRRGTRRRRRSSRRPRQSAARRRRSRP